MATYLALPFGSSWTWATCVRTRSGGLVTAQAHPASSGGGSRLSVSVWTDDDPPEAGPEIEIEASGVGSGSLQGVIARALSLGETRDGTLELYYLLDGSTLYRRESRDGGATWSSRETVPVTLVTPPSGGSQQQLLSVGHGYTRDGMTCLSLLQGYANIILFTANSWQAGERDGSGAYAWSSTQFPGAVGALGSYTGTPVQLLRTGDLSLRGRAVRVSRAKADGSATRAIDSVSTTSESDWWTEERLGMRVTVGVSILSSTQHYLQWRTRRLNSGGTLWENVATAAANTSAPTPVPLSPGNPVLNVFCRRDGVWEVLHADSGQRLRFARCRKLPMASTAANSVWTVD